MPKLVLKRELLSGQALDLSNSVYGFGNGRDGGGYLRTNNKFETETAFLGTNNSNEGLVNLNDKFGQSFWIRLNKGD